MGCEMVRGSRQWISGHARGYIFCRVENERQKKEKKSPKAPFHQLSQHDSQLEKKKTKKKKKKKKKIYIYIYIYNIYIYIPNLDLIFTRGRRQRSAQPRACARCHPTTDNRPACDACHYWHCHWAFHCHRMMMMMMMGAAHGCGGRIRRRRARPERARARLLRPGSRQARSSCCTGSGLPSPARWQTGRLLRNFFFFFFEQSEQQSFFNISSSTTKPQPS
jgi:hypothetical protein